MTVLHLLPSGHCVVLDHDGGADDAERGAEAAAADDDPGQKDNYSGQHV